MYFFDAFQIEEISINKNDYELLKFLTVDCMCFCSKRELLNIHKEKSFYEAFSEDEAKQILEKIEFHYTPKHASWLNAAEIEINVMDSECTGRRYPLQIVW